MSWIVEAKEVGDYQLAKAEVQRAIIIEMIDIGDQVNTAFPDPKTGKPKVSRQVNVTYELCDDILLKGEKAGMPLVVSRDYTLTLSGDRSLFKKVASSALGKAITKDDKINIEEIVGKPVMLDIVHVTNKKGRTSAKVNDISPVHKSIKFDAPVNPLKILRLDKFDLAVFKSLPEWKQKKVNLINVPEALRPKEEKTEF